MDDERWMYNHAAHANSSAVASAQNGATISLESLYHPAQPSGATPSGMHLNLSANRAALPQDVYDLVRAQAAPSPRVRSMEASSNDPQSPTQMLLSLLGLIPSASGGPGPSPRLALESAPSGSALQMLDMFQQDQPPQSSLSALLAQHGGTGLTPRGGLTPRAGLTPRGSADTHALLTEMLANPNRAIPQPVPAAHGQARFGMPEQSQLESLLHLTTQGEVRQQQPEPSSRVKAEARKSLGGSKRNGVHKKEAGRRDGWTERDRAHLVNLVSAIKPDTVEDWRSVARALETPREAEHVEQYYKKVLRHEMEEDPLAAKPAHGAGNKHGRRLNPRKGIPMHVMATYALMRLAGHEGNLSDMSAKIEENQFFSGQLDWTPRPGTKTYPRWKDALVGCFKPGRYPHLKKTGKKKEGLSIYALDEAAIPDKSRLKPAALVDVDPCNLPADFDMSNPLVPLHTQERSDGAMTVTTGRGAALSHEHSGAGPVTGASVAPTQLEQMLLTAGGDGGVGAGRRR